MSQAHPVPGAGVERIPTGIQGFETISQGGVPKGRTALVAGTAGSGKTIFACQFLSMGIEEFGENGVFVTFEDAPHSIRENVEAFGWDIARWEEEGRWRFIDASPQPGDDTVVLGDFDLQALLARIVQAVEAVDAKRVSIDSVNALFARLGEEMVLRQELFRLVHELKERGITVVLTAERMEDYGALSRHGIEEFVADGVILLRNVMAEERRRRTVEILKFRGVAHQTGEFPFTISAGDGIIVIPLSGVELTQASSTTRIHSGSEVLDEMCGGGFFRDSVILVSGATGTGKTLTTTQFLAGGYSRGERCLLFAFEESKPQLFRNAAAWGFDFAGMEKKERLRVVNLYPHALSLEDHLVRMKDIIGEFEPNRMAIDSLSALERVGTVRSFREFVINMTATIKQNEIAGLYTTTAPSLRGGESVTEKHISTLTDSIILLRYVESFGKLERGLTVLKMRGSGHDQRIRRFTIDGQGMHIGEPFQGVTGVLFGDFTYSESAKRDDSATDGAGEGREATIRRMSEEPGAARLRGEEEEGVVQRLPEGGTDRSGSPGEGDEGA